MSHVSDDFEKLRAGLEDSLTGKGRFEAVERLRALEEEWARALLGLSTSGETAADVRALVESGPAPAAGAEAVRHLEAAEGWQWEIGTWATGGGEGLASMSEVRALQTAQAWLHAALATGAGGSGSVERARKLAADVEADPNGMGRRHLDSVAALRARLDTK